MCTTGFVMNVLFVAIVMTTANGDPKDNWKKKIQQTMIQRATENHDLCFMSRKSFKSPLRDICRFYGRPKLTELKINIEIHLWRK